MITRSALPLQVINRSALSPRDIRKEMKRNYSKRFTALVIKRSVLLPHDIGKEMKYNYSKRFTASSD